MTDPEVIRATPVDRERVVDTVVAAFEADPAFRFFFPDDTSYRSHAATFAGYLFDKRVHHGTVWIVEGGSSVAMWDGPSAPVIEPAPVIESAPIIESPAGPVTLELPVDAIARLDAYEAVVQAAVPSTPCWYLGVLATHPDYAGRRWGRAVMSAGLEQAAFADLPSYLETTNPYNVDVYRRAGWEVMETVSVQGLRVWIMVHRG